MYFLNFKNFREDFLIFEGKSSNEAMFKFITVPKILMSTHFILTCNKNRSSATTNDT